MARDQFCGGVSFGRINLPGRVLTMHLPAGTYLSEKFLEHPDGQVCFEVNNKLQEYMDAMSGLCHEEASQIMCQSLVNMFRVCLSSKFNLKNN